VGLTVLENTLKPIDLGRGLGIAHPLPPSR